ncbi:MAG TPA: DoxX family protein [Myxococcota bacterium]|nr:DoxX family protein [Myxococcota bacterium]
MDFNSLGLLILRVGIAGTMALRHGLPKLLDFSNSMTTFPDPLGFGPTISLSLVVFAEFLCSILVLVGVFTRFSVVPVLVAMAVAFFVVHGSDPFAKKEMAFLYLTGFSCILAAGPGKFSADALFRQIK